MSRYNCKGVIILSIWKYQIELWFCPPNCIIPMHIHKKFYSRIIHIWGRALSKKKDKQKELPLFSFFKLSNIPNGIEHGLENKNNWFIFMNIETWTASKNKSNATIELEETSNAK